jgi:hypothetical protein
MTDPQWIDAGNRSVPKEDLNGNGSVSPVQDDTRAATNRVLHKRRPPRRRDAGRLLDLKEAEAYSGISAWTLRDMIASGDLPVVRPPRLRRVWIDRGDLDKAIAQWKDRPG